MNTSEASTSPLSVKVLRLYQNWPYLWEKQIFLSKSIFPSNGQLKKHLKSFIKLRKRRFLGPFWSFVILLLSYCYQRKNEKHLENTHTQILPIAADEERMSFWPPGREWVSEGLIRSYIFIVIPHVELQINLNKKNKCFDNILHNFIFTYCLCRPTTCFRRSERDTQCTSVLT